MRLNLIHRIFSVFIILMIGSCAYYNTMFNAYEYYKDGTEKLEKSQNNQITTDIQRDFNTAIDKCWKLINIHSDSNVYADDALLLIGKSHYQLAEYYKSERFLRQFVFRYPDSDLMPEARLWLARSLIELDRQQEAIDVINPLLEERVSRDIKSLALFSLGELYSNQDNPDRAMDYYNQCIEQSNDGKLAAKAIVALGDIYRSQSSFVAAIETYSRITDFNPPVNLEFTALMSKVASQIDIQQFDAALKTLRVALNQSRFLSHLAQIEEKIGDVYIFLGEYEEAEQQFLYVLEKYPRTEGSASAAFALAKLTEFFRSDPDSARNLYLRVSREFRTSEHLMEASERASTLENYMKIVERINTDINELNNLAAADSLPGEEELAADTIATEEKSAVNPPIKKTRNREDIIASLQKNRFNLAEFFLLTMQDYDSARTVYSEFISADSDSSLKIKAYYALYFIEKFHLMNAVRADSFKNIILNDYPESEFSEYFRSQDREDVAKADPLNQFHQKYLRAESLLFKDDYSPALRLFSEIAVEDSGSQWAEKSRYAIAWIYENKLKDIPKALQAYATIVNEYPKTEYAKIAREKIKEPPPEPDPTSQIDSTAVLDDVQPAQSGIQDRSEVEDLENASAETDSINSDEKKRIQEDLQK